MDAHRIQFESLKQVEIDCPREKVNSNYKQVTTKKIIHGQH